MKKIFAAAALVAIAVSPALAATTHRHHPVQQSDETNLSQNTYMPATGYYAVGPNGAAIGTDPDPFIRRSLMIEGDQNWSN